MKALLCPSTPRLSRSWRSALTGLALGWCATLPIGGCEDEDSGACTENETQACVCASGNGAQTCQADGTWGACSCGGNGNGGDDGGGNDDDGGNDDGGSNDDDGGNDDGGSEEHSCCLNGSFYECPDAEASGACFSNFNPGACDANASRNAECESGDDDGGGNDDDGNDDGGSCGVPGDSCQVHNDCCDSDVLCADDICSAACSFDSECASDCCADLEGGGGACSPSSFC